MVSFVVLLLCVPVLCLSRLLYMVLKLVLSLVAVFVRFARGLCGLLGLVVCPWPILELFFLCLTDRWGPILPFTLSGAGSV